MSDYRCPGCSANFTKSGYIRHLSKTTQPACMAVLASLGASSGHAVRAQPGGRFAGDYFGDNYEAGDFGWDTEEEGDEEEAVSRAMEDEDEEIVEQVNAALERDYPEPPRPALPGAQSHNPPEQSPPTPPRPSARKEVEDRFHRAPIVDRYPSAVAGQPIPGKHGETSDEIYRASLGNATDNPYTPFHHRIDWEVGHWAKTRGSGSTAFTDLLKIEGLRDKLGLSYGSAAELNAIIDKHLPGRPRFGRTDLVVDGEVFQLHSRYIIACVRALWGDSNLAPHLFVLPERHYIDKDKTVRMYHDMHTGKWWWATQAAVEKENPGATIIPIIISSDKTQLTLFGNKTAYPVYLTIGNIPKELRRKPSNRAYILLGYLPTSHMKHITNKAARRRPLETAGRTGLAMASGDGVIRRGHPIYAAFVGDYPEQMLVTGLPYGKCPSCIAEKDELGLFARFPLRDLDAILDALELVDGDPTEYKQACKHAGIKPIIHPFWENLPYTNIFRSITPDVLHQLYQGVVKHLIAWVSACLRRRGD
ncbi:hypothetical protein MKEN_00625500 [Mycena kentingensis (nom. inval.)]|nr:hypothetical protein MKEN_00625500 [Mycena kentingensis (nom. inval.)]